MTTPHHLQLGDFIRGFFQIDEDAVAVCVDAATPNAAPFEGYVIRRESSGKVCVRVWEPGGSGPARLVPTRIVRVDSRQKKLVIPNETLSVSLFKGRTTDHDWITPWYVRPAATMTKIFDALEKYRGSPGDLFLSDVDCTKLIRTTDLCVADVLELILADSRHVRVGHKVDDHRTAPLLHLGFFIEYVPLGES